MMGFLKNSVAAAIAGAFGSSACRRRTTAEARRLLRSKQGLHVRHASGIAGGTGSGRANQSQGWDRGRSDRSHRARPRQ